MEVLEVQLSRADGIFSMCVLKIGADLKPLTDFKQQTSHCQNL